MLCALQTNFFKFVLDLVDRLHCVIIEILLHERLKNFPCFWSFSKSYFRLFNSFNFVLIVTWNLITSVWQVDEISERKFASSRKIIINCQKLLQVNVFNLSLLVKFSPFSLKFQKFELNHFCWFLNKLLNWSWNFGSLAIFIRFSFGLTSSSILTKMSFHHLTFF